MRKLLRKTMRCLVSHVENLISGLNVTNLEVHHDLTFIWIGRVIVIELGCRIVLRRAELDSAGPLILACNRSCGEGEMKVIKSDAHASTGLEHVHALLENIVLKRESVR